MSRLVVIVAVIVSMMGCSFSSPFVTRNITVPGAWPPSGEPRPATPGKAPTLEEAYIYSADVKYAYRTAVRDQAKLETLLAVGLIPLTAAAIGVGATGGNPDLVLALGLTGAAALGLGNWLYNKPRQLAWVAGLKAVTCAEDALAPLNISPEMSAALSSHVTALREAVRGLEESIAKLETEADRAKALRDATDTSVPAVARAISALESVENAARAEVTDARAAVSAAEATLKTGGELEQTLRTAGRKLVVAVSKITDEVDRLVVESGRDPAALANVISGLGGTYRTITAVPEGVARTGAKEAAAAKPSSVPQARREDDSRRPAFDPLLLEPIDFQQRALLGALEATRVQAARAAAARRLVGDIVNSVVKDTPFDKLKGCGVDAGDLITAVTVDPAPPFTITKPGSVAFTIKGGLPPYGVGLAAGPGGLNVAAAGPFSPVITASATKETPDGDFAVEVRDSKNQSKLVTITVVSRPADATDRQGGATGAADALTQLATRLDRDKPDVEAQGVTVKVTGAKVDGNRVVLTIGQPRVAQGANTDGVARAIRDKVHAVHARDLALTPDQIAFDDPSPLAKDVLDARPQPQSACEPVRLGGPVRADPLFNTLSADDRKRVQVAVCLVGKQVDGIWGPITKGRVIQYQCSRRMSRQDGALSQQLVDELLKLDGGAIQRRCGAR